MNENKASIFTVENAHITYRNFSGEARQYNNAGNRNFNLILDPEQAKIFEEAGFRVRERSGKDGHKDDAIFLLQVNVSYKYRPPKVIVIRNRKKAPLTEETISELDYADIEYIDLTIRPYHWRMPDGRTGVKAYLNSMYVTLVDDPFEDKYYDPEDEADGDFTVEDEETPF